MKINFLIILSFLIFQCTDDIDSITTINDPKSESATSEQHHEINPACNECDYVVKSTITDGDSLNIRPGQTICLDASIPYGGLVFRNIRGTYQNPVMIKNCGGVAEINSKNLYGVKFQKSKHFRLIGNGDPKDPFGIKITTEKGFYLTLEQFTTSFEIAQIEIAGKSKHGLNREIGGFAGIGVKTSPYQDCQLFTDKTRSAWVMRNVSIHNNYIHDTGGEGIYIGHGFYSGRKETACPKVTYSHSIKGLRVYENLIENVGYDGIQIKNADHDVLVFRNIIRNFGTRQHEPQNEGLFIGEGTTGKFYLNTIAVGTGDGIKVQGIGNLDIFKNKILYPDKDGINVSFGAFGYRLSSGYFNIRNNIIHKPNGNGFVFYNEQGGSKKFHDNMIIEPGEDFIKRGAVIELYKNEFTYKTPVGIRDKIGTLSENIELLEFDPL